MPAENITPKHQQEFLTNLVTYLQEFEYDASLIESEVGDGKTYTTMYVVVDISSEQLPGENQLRVETAFLPQAEDDKGTHSILQTMVPVLVADQAVDKNELFGLIIKLNTFMPMGAFGYWEEQNMVYHKQNNMVANKSNDGDYASFEEQLAMIQYVLTSFVPSLAAAALDGKTVKEALESNPFAQVFTQ